jgi:uncharacterized membrane protein
VFHLNVAKVDLRMLHMLQWHYTHVASLCFKCFSFFQTYVWSVSSGCCITGMIQAHVSSVWGVSYVCCKYFICCKSRSGCCICCYEYTRISQMHVSCVSYVLSRMLIYPFVKVSTQIYGVIFNLFNYKILYMILWSLSKFVIYLVRKVNHP